MSRRINLIKKKLNGNRYPVCIAAVILCCILVVSGLLIFMPEGYAAGSGTQSDPYDLSLKVNGNGSYSASMQAGNYYKLSGNYKRGINFTVLDEAKGDVYLILDNCNFDLSSVDEPALSFGSETKYISAQQGEKFNADYLKGGEVKVHLILSGDSAITGMNDALSPLIQVEKYQYVTERYNSTANGLDNVSIFTYYRQNISLDISSIHYSEDDYGLSSGGRDTLTLTTGRDSFGAAIGGSEEQKAIDDSGIAAALSGMNTSESNKEYPFKSFTWRPDWQNIFVYRTGSYLKDLSVLTAGEGGPLPVISYGSGDVTVSSGTVNIYGNGYGAGIGNGGSKTADKTVVAGNGNIVSIFGKAIDVKTTQTVPKIQINDGTVSVVMAESSKGSCFSNGAIATNSGAAADGRVVIEGGSVYVKRQGADRPYENAYNSKGDHLYAFAAKYQSDILKYGISNGDNLKDRAMELENISETENEDYEYSINGFKFSNQLYDTFSGSDKLEYLRTSVYLGSDGYGGSEYYTFNGFYHDISGEGDTLYFYLPAIKLETYNLDISSGLDGVVYSYAQMDNRNLTDITALEAKDDFKPWTDDSTVKEGKYVYIKAEGIPEYCEDISVSYTYNVGGTETTVPLSVIRAADRTAFYVISPSQNISDVKFSFTYTMGKFNIIYDYGLAEKDKNAAYDGSIVNPNGTSGECGKIFDLSDDVKWEGHTFEGWYADAAFTVPKTDISTTVVGSNETVYAKWSCNIVYKTEMGTFKGTNPASSTFPAIKVDYNSTYDVMGVQSPDYANDIELGDMAKLVKFIGWAWNDSVYTGEGSTPTVITVTENTEITARFKRSGYYVYITAVNDSAASGEKVNIKNFLADGDSFRMDYSSRERQTLSDMDADMFYRTTGFIDATEDYATITLVPKAGYKISGKNVTDSEGKAVNLISNDAANVFSFNIADMTAAEKDIYIYIHFDVEQYGITYYDIVNGMPVQIDGAPNPDSYTVNDSIVFVRPDKTEKGRYWKFIGFKKLGTDVLMHSITEGTTGNISLVAQWEEVEVYGINISQGKGIIKAYVGDEEVTRAAEGEIIRVEATAVKGVKLKRLETGWSNGRDGKETFNIWHYDVTDTTVSVSFEMPAADVNINGEFEAVQYLITYLNLNSASNVNPNTYTVFDSFELKTPEKEGRVFKGWQLITPDTDTADDPNDVKRTDISRIDNMTGNLMLYAQWDESVEEPRVYYASVDKNIVNGKIQLAKTEANRNEYILVTVEEKEGYRLSSLVYNLTGKNRKVVSPLAKAYIDLSAGIDISANQLSDGIYYFLMPDSDVEITAVFTPISYTISYILNGGENSNVTSYTVEDRIELNDAVKEGWIFEGWYDENGKKTEKIENTFGDIVLTAKWTEKSGDEGTDKPSGNGGNNDENTSNGGSGANGGNTSNNTADNESPNAGINKPSTETRPNTYVTGGVQTGDSSNIARLIVICVICAAALCLILVIPKRKKKDEKSSEEETDKSDKIQ